MAENRMILQLRVTRELYQAITAEVERRRQEGDTRASRNSVAIEWMEQGKDCEKETT